METLIYFLQKVKECGCLSTLKLTEKELDSFNRAKVEFDKSLKLSYNKKALVTMLQLINK